MFKFELRFSHYGILNYWRIKIELEVFPLLFFRTTRY